MNDKLNDYLKNCDQNCSIEPHYVKVLIDAARDKEYRSLQNKKITMEYGCLD